MAVNATMIMEMEVTVTDTDTQRSTTMDTAMLTEKRVEATITIIKVRFRYLTSNLKMTWKIQDPQRLKLVF